MNIKTYILFAFTALAFMACSHIDEDERLIYVKPAAVQRSVLLEDFTGQRCINSFPYLMAYLPLADVLP